MGLYGSEVVSPWGRCFQTGGLVYDRCRRSSILYIGLGGEEPCLGKHIGEKSGFFTDKS